MRWLHETDGDIYGLGRLVLRRVRVLTLDLLKLFAVNADRVCVFAPVGKQLREDAAFAVDYARLLSLLAATGVPVVVFFIAAVLVIDGFDFALTGNVLEEEQGGASVIEVRNKIVASESLETLCPSGDTSTMTMPQPLVTTDGEQVDFANNSQFLLCPEKLPPYTILRRVNA